MQGAVELSRPNYFYVTQDPDHSNWLLAIVWNGVYSSNGKVQHKKAETNLNQRYNIPTLPFSKSSVYFPFSFCLFLARKSKRQRRVYSFSKNSFRWPSPKCKPCDKHRTIQKSTALHLSMINRGIRVKLPNIFFSLKEVFQQREKRLPWGEIRLSKWNTYCLLILGTPYSLGSNSDFVLCWKPASQPAVCLIELCLPAILN